MSVHRRLISRSPDLRIASFSRLIWLSDEIVSRMSHTTPLLTSVALADCPALTSAAFLPLAALPELRDLDVSRNTNLILPELWTFFGSAHIDRLAASSVKSFLPYFPALCTLKLSGCVTMGQTQQKLIALISSLTTLNMASCRLAYLDKSDCRRTQDGVHIVARN